MAELHKELELDPLPARLKRASSTVIGSVPLGGSEVMQQDRVSAGRRARTDTLAVMLRFLLAAILATMLVYSSSAIEQVIAIFKT